MILWSTCRLSKVIERWFQTGYYRTASIKSLISKKKQHWSGVPLYKKVVVVSEQIPYYVGILYRSYLRYIIRFWTWFYVTIVYHYIETPISEVEFGNLTLIYYLGSIGFTSCCLLYFSLHLQCRSQSSPIFQQIYDSVLWSISHHTMWRISQF